MSLIVFFSAIFYIISFIVFIINLIRKKGRKKSLIVMLSIFFVFIISFGIQLKTDDRFRTDATTTISNATGNKLTLEKFEECKDGMTKEQIDNIIGNDGALTSEGYGRKTYSYKGYGTIGANALLDFENGKLVSKEQTGLK